MGLCNKISQVYAYATIPPLTLISVLNKRNRLARNYIKYHCCPVNIIDNCSVFMVFLGVNCFMQIVDMKIEKSLLHRHYGMLLAGIHCFKSRFRLKACRNDDWKVNGTAVIKYDYFTD